MGMLVSCFSSASKKQFWGNIRKLRKPNLTTHVTGYPLQWSREESNMSLCHVALFDTLVHTRSNIVIHFLLRMFPSVSPACLHENIGLQYYSVSNQPFESPLIWLAAAHHLMLKMRQRSPWQPQLSEAVAANPLGAYSTLVRGFYQQHQCPRISPKQTLDLMFIHPEEANKPSYSSWEEQRGENDRPGSSGKLLFYLRYCCSFCPIIAQSVWPAGWTAWEHIGKCCEKAWHVLHCMFDLWWLRDHTE